MNLLDKNDQLLFSDNTVTTLKDLLKKANLAGAYLTGATYNTGTFNKGLLQLTGLTWPVLIFDNHIKIGCKFYTTNEWENFSDFKIKQMAPKALNFWKKHKDLIITLANKHQNP